MSYLTFYGDMFPIKKVEFESSLPDPYVFNLEAPLTRAKKGYPGKVNLRGGAEFFDQMFSSPPTAVCLANNHIMDFGEEGFLDTVNFLREKNITFFGAGYLADNCNNPVLVNVDGIQVGMMGYVSPDASPVFASGDAAGCMPIDVQRIARDIKLALERGAERIVVQLHWGAEQVSMPNPNDVGKARAVVEAGADVVVGHHAHCIQAFEVYKGKYIFYGVGNWIFPAHQSPSYYTADGTPSKLYISHPHEKNKRSLAVRYEPTENEVVIEPCYFDGVSIGRGKFRAEQYRKKMDLTQGYKAQFERAFRWGKFRHILEGYLASPKLPQARHIKGVLKIIQSKQYK